MRAGLRAAYRRDWTAANPAFEKALAETSRFHGAKAFETGAVAATVAQKQVEQERWTEAERLFREAYVIFMDLGRIDKAAAVVQEYAPVLCALNKHADAANLLRWALDAADSGAIDASTRGPLAEQLAETLLRAGKPAQAIPHYEQAAALLEAGGRRTTCELATAVTNLGLAYAFAGQADQGDVRLRRGLDVAERRCPTALPATLVARAHYEMEFGTRAKAGPLLERASVLAREHKDRPAFSEAQRLQAQLDRTAPDRTGAAADAR